MSAEHGCSGESLTRKSMYSSFSVRCKMLILIKRIATENEDGPPEDPGCSHRASDLSPALGGAKVLRPLLRSSFATYAFDGCPLGKTATPGHHCGHGSQSRLDVPSGQLWGSIRQPSLAGRFYPARVPRGSRDVQEKQFWATGAKGVDRRAIGHRTPRDTGDRGLSARRRRAPGRQGPGRRGLPPAGSRCELRRAGWNRSTPLIPPLQSRAAVSNPCFCEQPRTCTDRTSHWR